MNFTELFDNLPASSFEDWETAARAQLKGKPLDSINISLGGGATTAPYAIGTETSLTGGSSQGWVQFATFSNEVSVSADLLLEALNGGAQGIDISFRELAQIERRLKDIRFDFISLKLHHFEPNDIGRLLELVPEDQRSGSKLVIALGQEVKAAEYQELVEIFGEVSFLLAPKLEVGDAMSLNSVFSSIKNELSRDKNLDFFTDKKVSLGIEIALSSDYLSNISFIRAAHLLFANSFNSFGFKQPLPRPYLYGKISPTIEGASHETYLIDATARAVAGISGGLDGLAIEAFPDADVLVASRRARNIQNVLAIEGLLGMPLNAVQGAAFFESTAKDLVSAVWSDY